MKSNLTTLCYIENKDNYLMLHRTKKENDINKDKWIGVGGHFEPGESPDECLIREVMEETGLTLTSYRLRGIITFSTNTWQTEYMFLYTATTETTEFGPCNEGELVWVTKDKINNLNLWEGDKIFFKLLNEREDMFSLKLTYYNDTLTEAVLDGTPMELFETLNPDGSFSGKTKERSLVHETGALHATSHVWLVRPNPASGYDILLQKRSMDKDSFPGCYDISSAGHIPYGETFVSSALRELKEELGISATEEDLHFIGIHQSFSKEIFHGKRFLNNEYSHVFLYLCENEPNFVLQTSEVDSVRWMDFAECVEAVKANTIPNCIFLEELNLIKENLDIK